MDLYRYYSFPDGSVAERVVTTDDPGKVIPVPDGATEITADEYAARLAQIQAANEQQQADTQAAEAAAKKAAYDELRAAGISDAVARTLSGYQGP